MRRTLGVLVMEHIAVGVVEGDKVVGPLRMFPEKENSAEALLAMPVDRIAECLRQQIESAAHGQEVHAPRFGVPGVRQYLHHPG